MTSTARKLAPPGVDPRPDLDDYTPEEQARFDVETRVKQDLALLARHYPRLYGRAFDPDRTTWGDDGIDEHRDAALQRSRERAVVVHRRFESMRTGDGCLHYQVLHWCYIERGGAFDVGALGIAFATRAQRKAWQAKRRSIASAAPIKSGERLLAAALAAYAKLGR